MLTAMKTSDLMWHCKMISVVMSLRDNAVFVLSNVTVVYFRTRNCSSLASNICYKFVTFSFSDSHKTDNTRTMFSLSPYANECVKAQFCDL